MLVGYGQRTFSHLDDPIKIFLPLPHPLEMVIDRTAPTIDNALANRYQITILEGYYWQQTENVFDNYINYLYEFKEQAMTDSAQYPLERWMIRYCSGESTRLLDHALYHLTSLHPQIPG